MNTARAGLVTARARLGFMLGSVYCKMRFIIVKKRSPEQGILGVEFSEKLKMPITP